MLKPLKWNILCVLGSPCLWILFDFNCLKWPFIFQRGEAKILSFVLFFFYFVCHGGGSVTRTPCRRNFFAHRWQHCVGLRHKLSCGTHISLKSQARGVQQKVATRAIAVASYRHISNKPSKPVVARDFVPLKKKLNRRVYWFEKVLLIKWVPISGQQLQLFPLLKIGCQQLRFAGQLHHSILASFFVRACVCVCAGYAACILLVWLAPRVFRVGVIKKKCVCRCPHDCQYFFRTKHTKQKTETSNKCKMFE